MVGVERDRVFEMIPRNVRHFRKAELLALIHVHRARQAEFHQDRRTGTARAEVAVSMYVVPSRSSQSFGSS